MKMFSNRTQTLPPVFAEIVEVDDEIRDIVTPKVIDFRMGEVLGVLRKRRNMLTRHAELCLRVSDD